MGKLKKFCNFLFLEIFAEKIFSWILFFEKFFGGF